MPTKVYVCGAAKETRAARTWLARAGFDATPQPPESPVWADETRKALAAADVVVALASGKGAGQVAEYELGVAAGLGKRVLAVGPAERMGYGYGGFVRCPDWDHAKRALAHIGTGAPEVVLSPADANYVMKFWNDFAVKVVNLPQYIDRYAPGLAARVADHARARGGIYRAAVEAWKAAGSPGLVAAPPAEGALSPESADFCEHTAVSEWFAKAVRLAEIDHTRESLARDREAVLAEVGPFNDTQSPA